MYCRIKIEIIIYCLIFLFPSFLSPATEGINEAFDMDIKSDSFFPSLNISEKRKSGSSTLKEQIVSDKKNNSSVLSKIFPRKNRISVPFLSQAPFGDWGEPYQEACEEAAVLMASAYFNKEQAVGKKTADERIKKLVLWENEHFGSYEHTDTKQTAKMAEEYFSLQAKVITDVSEDTIKTALLEGKLVLAPTAGRMLGNPYYSGKGPLYHMLLIIGWDETGFITHDPGTKRGENYHYPYGRIMKAIHDWNNGDIYSGTPMIITVFSL